MILRPKHYDVIERLATTDLPLKEVAKQMHMSPRTLGRWLKDPDFREALQRRREARPEVFRTLAVSTSRRLLADLLGRLEAGAEKPPAREVLSLATRILREVPAMIREEARSLLQVEDYERRLQKDLDLLRHEFGVGVDETGNLLDPDAGCDDEEDDSDDEEAIARVPAQTS